jgi:hypothetical protein
MRLWFASLRAARRIRLEGDHLGALKWSRPHICALPTTGGALSYDAVWPRHLPSLAQFVQPHVGASVTGCVIGCQRRAESLQGPYHRRIVVQRVYSGSPVTLFVLAPAEQK